MSITRAFILASKDKQTFFTLPGCKNVLTQGLFCRTHPPFRHVLLEVFIIGAVSEDC